MLSPTRIFFCLLFLIPAISAGDSFALTAEEIAKVQPTLEGRPIGEKIAFWAEKFLGTSYDRDPLGEYVTRAAVEADERVDCMYLTFRAVELALARTPEEAVRIALEKRFHSRGVLRHGKVANYEDRFEYGEDMVESGKWGKEITSLWPPTTRIAGSRGKEFWEAAPPAALMNGVTKLKSGDILFFMTPPEKRTVGEAVGHIGIVKVDPEVGEKQFYLIHASGTKTRGGAVKKVILKDYLAKMRFVGVKVTRFE